MDLLSADEQPVDPGVLKVSLEEPVKGQVHTGVGNLRGWAVASEGITKVEILVDGVLAFEAPYGAERGDVGSAFPNVAGSSESGFSLAYNYSGLSAGSPPWRQCLPKVKFLRGWDVWMDVLFELDWTSVCNLI
mgnify:CR=1 FL=1